MEFPTTQTLESFLEEQVAKYSKRLRDSAPHLVFQLSGITVFGDEANVVAMGFEAENDAESHLYFSKCQFTGREAVSSAEIKPRIAAMNQAVEYTEALVDKLNDLGGWTHYKGM
jgi:hypothetical protein